MGHSWEIAGASIQGARPDNQDAFQILGDGFAVFDGVAGLENGKEAAWAAADALAEALDSKDPVAWLQRCARATGGATTAVIVRLGVHCTVWTLGDSSIFHIGRGMVRLTPSDGIGNMITRALGLDGAVPHTKDIRVENGDSLLACSDGVTKVLDESELEAIVRRYDPEKAVAEILSRVEAAGAPDNATLVVCRANEL